MDEAARHPDARHALPADRGRYRQSGVVRFSGDLPDDEGHRLGRRRGRASRSAARAGGARGPMPRRWRRKARSDCRRAAASWRFTRRSSKALSPVPVATSALLLIKTLVGKTVGVITASAENFDAGALRGGRRAGRHAGRGPAGRRSPFAATFLRNGLTLDATRWSVRRRGRPGASGRQASRRRHRRVRMHQPAAVQEGGAEGRGRARVRRARPAARLSEAVGLTGIEIAAIVAERKAFRGFGNGAHVEFCWRRLWPSPLGAPLAQDIGVGLIVPLSAPGDATGGQLIRRGAELGVEAVNAPGRACSAAARCKLFGAGFAGPARRPASPPIGGWLERGQRRPPLAGFFHSARSRSR